MAYQQLPTNTQKEEKYKSRRILGAILTVVGGLLTLLSFYIWSRNQGFSEGEILAQLFCIGLGIIGILLVVLGIFFILHKWKINNRQIWGWIEVIIGIPFMLWGLIIFYPIFDSVFTPSHATQYDISGSLICVGPGLIIGIPLLILGIRQITHKETTAPANPGSLDKP
jgi:hypothetical protein